MFSFFLSTQVVVEDDDDDDDEVLALKDRLAAYNLDSSPDKSSGSNFLDFAFDTSLRKFIVAMENIFVFKYKWKALHICM